MNLANGAESHYIFTINGHPTNTESLKIAEKLLRQERNSVDKSNILSTVLTRGEIFRFSAWKATVIDKLSSLNKNNPDKIDRLEELQLAVILYKKSSTKSLVPKLAPVVQTETPTVSVGAPVGKVQKTPGAVLAKSKPF